MLSKYASTAGRKLSIWAIRLVAKLMKDLGWRIWESDDRLTELGTKVIRCANRLRIRAYEMERRNQ